jgi:hypothetical protein
MSHFVESDANDNILPIITPNFEHLTYFYHSHLLKQSWSLSAKQNKAALAINNALTMGQCIVIMPVANGAAHITWIRGFAGIQRDVKSIRDNDSLI